MWIILILMYFFSFYVRKESFLFNFFKHLGEKVIPGLANILLIPFTMVLFQVLFCEKGTSQDILDSFMNRDCDTFCWQGDHISYVVSGLVVIFTLNVITLCYRSVYSFYLTDRNILVLPLYNYIKGVYQALLPLISIILK